MRMNVGKHPHILPTTTPHTHSHAHTKAITEYLGEIALFSLPFFSLSKASTKDSKAEKACFSLSFPPSLSLPVSCPWKRGGQAQTAWERLTTRGSERRYIKGHPICTAAYTHPHIHKHRLTYLGLLSLKFITSGRTITLFDSVCVSQLQEEESSAHKQFGSAQKLGSFGTLPALSPASALFLVCEGESTARAWKRFIHRCNQKMCRAQQIGLTSHFPWLVV